MIDDIKDLTEHQKRKREQHQYLTSAFLKTFVLMLIASVGMAIFSIFATGDFVSAFTNERALETAGRIVIFMFLMSMMFLRMHQRKI